MGKRLEQIFLQRRYTNGHKHMKECSTPSLGEMQIRTARENNKCFECEEKQFVTGWWCLLQCKIKIVKRKKRKITSVGESMEKFELFCAATRNVKWGTATVENSMAVFRKTKGFRGLPWWSSGQDSVLPMRGLGFDPWSGN